MKAKPVVLGLVTAIAGWAALAISQQAALGATTTYSPTSAMTFVTANIGRDYGSGSKITEVMTRIRHNLYDVSNGRPRYIGWQEIDEDDPAAELSILKDVYKYDGGWERTLYRDPDGIRVPLKVPNVAHDAQKSDQRVAFGSSGMDGISPTRWITITRYQNQNISQINTHFIAGAFKDCPTCAERRDRWWAHWRSLKDQVAREHNAGFNVVLTGDFNRRPDPGGWNPTNVHPDARHVKNGGIDHIVAVPRGGWKVVKQRYANGSYQQGEWWIGIDTHQAHWVKLRFLRQ
ncbi:MAG: hypothetical protein ACRDT6_18810 [Micromonosporaceae bacterium]